MAYIFNIILLLIIELIPIESVLVSPEYNKGKFRVLYSTNIIFTIQELIYIIYHMI